MPKKYTKVGAVLDTGNGPFVVLGDEKNPKEQYRTTVEIRVKDNTGKVLTSAKNGTLAVFDPRTRPGIKEEQAAKISKKVLSELFIVEEA